MTKEVTDPAQELYKNSTKKIENKDNNANIALILAIAAWIPIVNIGNFFFLYNFVSVVFAIRVLRKKKKLGNEKTIAIVSIVINLLNFVLSVILILYVISRALQTPIPL